MTRSARPTRRRGRRRIEDAFSACGQLRGRGYRLEQEVPLERLLSLAKLAATPPPLVGIPVYRFGPHDLAALRGHVFDYVLFAPDDEPLVAIEFDGPCHARSARARADKRKNLACSLGGLCLWRLESAHVQPRDKCSLVEWALGRFEKHVLGVDRERYETPGIDPSFWFDVLNPFPGTLAKAHFLRREYGIWSEHVDDKLVLRGDPPILWEFEYAGSVQGPLTDNHTVYRQRVFRTLYEVGQRGLRNRRPVVSFFGDTSETWSLPTPKVGGLLWTDESPFNSIPGMSFADLAYGFAEYMAFVEAARWARQHLISPGGASQAARSSAEFVSTSLTSS